MQTPFARYFCFRKIDMFSGRSKPLPYKTRYDINLVAERQHIECKAHIESFTTYRKSYKRFISTISSSMKSLYHMYSSASIYISQNSVYIHKIHEGYPGEFKSFLGNLPEEWIIRQQFSVLTKKTGM